MAAPGVPVKGTANAGTATSVTPSYPASVAANDIIWLLAISHQPVSIGVIDLPSGFTQVAQGTYQNSAPANQGRAALFWKRAAGGESGTVTVSRTGDTGVDGVFFAQMYKQSGCNTSGDPYDAVTPTYGPGNATVQYGSVTVGGSERTLLAFIAQADNASTVDPPSTYSGLVNDVTSSGTDAELLLCYKQNVSTDGSTTSTGGETEGWTTFHVSVAPVAAVSHATSGTLAGPGSTIAGSASSATTRPSSGVLVGPGSAIVGSASRTHVHASTGVLAGPGSAIVGSASRTHVHPTTGVIVGPSATIAGSADRQGTTVTHETSGALSGQGSAIVGSADSATIRTSSGILTGQGSAVAGTAARTRVHATTGVLQSQGSVVSGTAAHIAIHTAAGSLIAQGSIIVGSANRIGEPINHETTGALVGPGSAASGSANRISSGIMHEATGTIIGQGSMMLGYARNLFPHDSLPSSIPGRGSVSSRAEDEKKTRSPQIPTGRRT